MLQVPVPACRRKGPACNKFLPFTRRNLCSSHVPFAPVAIKALLATSPRHCKCQILLVPSKVLFEPATNTFLPATSPRRCKCQFLPVTDKFPLATSSCLPQAPASARSCLSQARSCSSQVLARRLRRQDLELVWKRVRTTSPPFCTTGHTETRLDSLNSFKFKGLIMFSLKRNEFNESLLLFVCEACYFRRTCEGNSQTKRVPLLPATGPRHCKCQILLVPNKILFGTSPGLSQLPVTARHQSLCGFAPSPCLCPSQTSPCLPQASNTASASSGLSRANFAVCACHQQAPHQTFTLLLLLL